MNGAIIGYARVSTTDQNLEVQLAALEKYGCERIFSEKKSGVSMDKRPQLEAMLNYIREGDTLVIAKMDRLGRSLMDMLRILKFLEDKGVKFVALDQNIDQSTTSGRAFMQMLMVFAEFENNMRRDRQAEGIARAKAEGVYTRKKIPKEKIKGAGKLLEIGYTYAQAAQKTGISKPILYREFPQYQIMKRVNGKNHHYNPETGEVGGPVAKSVDLPPAPKAEETGVEAILQSINVPKKPGMLEKIFKT